MIARLDVAVRVPHIPDIEDWIDLHGFAPRDVVSVVEEYLEAAARKGYHEVRLVHGRGKGVQRRNVQARLATHPLVLGYRDAPPARGGLGATLVWLRRVDATGRTRWLWPIPADEEIAGRQWRALVEQALARADRVCWSADERGRPRLAWRASFPFVGCERAPDAATVFAALARELGEPCARRCEGRWRWCWSITPAVGRVLLERAPGDWAPQGPTLLEGEVVVLAAARDEVSIQLDARERERLDLDLIPQ